MPRTRRQSKNVEPPPTPLVLRNRPRFDLSSMSEEEINEMMDSIDTASSESESEGDFDDDDSVADPNFRLSREDEDEIDEQIGRLGRATSADYFAQAINLSINLSNLSLPLAESSPPSPTEQPIFPVDEQPGPSHAQAGPSHEIVEPPTTSSCCQSIETCKASTLSSAELRRKWSSCTS